VVRRPPRSPTNCAKVPRVSSPRQPPPASLSSCPRGRLSFPRGALDPSLLRRDPGRSGHSLPGAYAKHLVALLGDAPLGVPISGLVPGWHQPQIGAHAAALFEAVGVLQGEHEGERSERPDPLDLSQELRFRVALLSDRLQLSVVLADALGERADLLQDGTQSRPKRLGDVLLGPLVEAPRLRTWATLRRTI
jgi:hypothetical protein